MVVVPPHLMSEVPGRGVATVDKVVALTFDDGPDPAYTPKEEFRSP
jgi:peptidoglycan/xylan/chitin deacetylase (PgdA/CDA1 family)